MARRRSSKALINDDAIRAAAIKLLLSVGFDAISFRDVGREAGLTHGALYARFEDVEELLVDLWASELREHALAMVDIALKAATEPSKESIAALIDCVRNTSPADAATVQVLLASRRFVILHEEIESFIHDLEAKGGDLDPAIHSRAMVLFSLILIMTLTNDRFGRDDDCLDFLAPVLLHSLAVSPDNVDAVTLHDASERVMPLPKSDIRSQLAYHTFSAVGKSGYTRATISRISRRANCSPGAIYKLYPSKEDLVISAVRAVMKAPWITIDTLRDILEEGSMAQLLFSSASPENEVRRSFTIEIAMASAHSDKLRSAVQNQLQGLEVLVPLITGLEEEENRRLGAMIRSIVLVTLGVSFLSTVTKMTEQMDFNQFAEPLRRAMLDVGVPSWPDIRLQLQALGERVQPPVLKKV